jgi:pimeloyl-ACP methyl ester carboxylesterase
VANAIPMARFHLISGSGHMPMMENPKEFAAGLNWLISQMDMS